jgi:uncharacterized protein (UPF0371 family)
MDLSKGVTHNVRVQLKEDDKNSRSFGVRLTSEKVIKREKRYRYCTIVNSNKQFLNITPLNEGHILKLNITGHKSNIKKTNNLYTFGISSNINGDDFVQLFEPKLLNKMNNICVNKLTNKNTFLMCKVVYENDHNHDMGHIVTIMTLNLNKNVPK